MEYSISQNPNRIMGMAGLPQAIPARVFKDA
jgi:hypothetical protein